jgi:hypothetical protein
VQIRSPGKSQLQQLLQQHCPLGSVTQRLTGAAPTTGANGHGSLLPHQQQQQHHHQHHLHQQTGPHSKLPGSHTLQDRLRQQRLMLLKRLAIWVSLGIAAIVLLSSLAPAAEVPPAPPKDVLLELGPYFFNPSIVRHRGVFLSTARTAHMKRIDKTNWWFNEVSGTAGQQAPAVVLGVTAQMMTNATASLSARQLLDVLLHVGKNTCWKIADKRSYAVLWCLAGLHLHEHYGRVQFRQLQEV